MNDSNDSSKARKASMADDDARLVRAALAGDTRAFETLVERYLGMVYAIAYARVGHAETAEDLVQEVFLRASLYLKELRQPVKFSSWLSRITRNQAIDWLRRDSSGVRLVPLLEIDGKTQDIPDTQGKGEREAMEDKERDRALREAIFALPPEERELVLLHYTEELNYREIARRLDVHPVTVGRRLEQALATLKEALEPVLREAAPRLGAPKSLTAKTLLVVAAAAALSAEAKAALAVTGGVVGAEVAAAGGALAAGGGLFGFLKAIPPTLKAGALAMSLKMKITAAIAAISLISGGTYYTINKQGAAPRPASTAPALKTAVKPSVVKPVAVKPTAATDGGPGWKIEAEDYDKGGEGVGYHDVTKGNIFRDGQPGVYRQDDVDIKSVSPGSYFVNTAAPGEWLAYSIDVPAAGKYDLDINMATNFDDRRVTFELDGEPLTGKVTLPATGDWLLFQDVTLPALRLPAGRHQLKLIYGNGYLNVDYLRFKPLSSGWERESEVLTVKTIWGQTGAPALGTTVTLHGDTADGKRWRSTVVCDATGQAALRYPKQSAGELGHLLASHPYAKAALRQDYPLATQGENFAQLQHSTTVFGRVTLGPGQSGSVEGARVGLLGSTHWMYVGADGAFEFAPVTRNITRLIAIREALCSFATPAAIESFDLIEDQRNGPFELVLQNGPLLQGKVTAAETGQPVAGASVSVVQQGGEDTTQRANDVTDDEGAYQLAGLFGDRYQLELAAEGYATNKLTINQAASKRTTRDFKLEPGALVTVTVADASGQPLPGARIQLQAGNRYSVHPDRTDATGRVVFQGVSPTDPPRFSAGLSGYNSPIPQEPVFAPDQKTATLALVMTSAASAKPKELGYFMGRVTAKDGGGPVAGATVKWVPYYNMRDAKEKTLTGADGSYELTGTMGDDNYVLVVWAAGFAPDWKTTTQPGDATEPKLANFELDTGHWLELVVTDEDGRPAPDVFVRARPASNDDLRNYDLPGQPWHPKTDALGRLRLKDLPAPSVNLSLDSNSFSSVSQQNVSVDGETKIVMPSMGLILGRVLDNETKQPIGEFTLKASGLGLVSDRQRLGELHSDVEGRFKLERLSLESKYSVTLVTEGYTPLTVTGVPAARSGQATAREYFLKRGKGLVVQLIGAETKQPIAGARIVSAMLKPQSANSSHRSIQWEQLNEDYNQDYQDFQRALTDAEGKIALQEGAEKRTLFISAPGYQRQLVEPNERTKYQSGGAGLLTVPLKAGGRIAGVLYQDGQPQAGAQVGLYLSKDNRSEGYGSITTDAAGKYAFDGLASGGYQLYAQAREGDFSYTRLSLKTNLGEGESKTLAFGKDLGPHTVSGTITGDDKPLPHASIQVTNQFGWEYATLADYSDANGKYKIAGLRPGSYSMYVSSRNPQGGGLSRNRTLPLEVAGDLAHDFDLSGGKKVTARLVFPATMTAEKRARYGKVTLQYSGQDHQTMQREGYDQNKRMDLNGEKLETTGRFKGQYRVSISYRQTHERSASVPLGDFEIDNLAGDRALGEIRLGALGEFRLRLSHADPSLKPREMMAVPVGENGRVMPQDQLSIDANLSEQKMGPLPEGTHKIRFMAIGFTVDPPEATVTIVAGKTPEIAVTVKPDGMCFGMVSGADGGVPAVRQITLTGNGVNRTLKPVQGTEMDVMRLWTDVQDIALTLERQRTLFIIRGLKKGEYTLAIEADGYEKFEDKRQIEPGKPDMRGETIRLKKSAAAAPTRAAP